MTHRAALPSILKMVQQKTITLITVLNAAALLRRMVMTNDNANPSHNIHGDNYYGTGRAWLKGSARSGL